MSLQIDLPGLLPQPRFEATTDEKEWDQLDPFWRSPLGLQTKVAKILTRLREERAKYTVYPAPEHLWTPLKYLNDKNTKVIWVGQDPYHGPGQAIGRAFAVPESQPQPPSLRNLEKELRTNDVPQRKKPLKDLKHWEEQGILLLNTCLSVRAGEPLSHADLGWEEVTSQWIEKLTTESTTPKVVVLLGSRAMLLKQHIGSKKHVVIEAPHPSPLSAYRGFFGSKIFQQIESQLVRLGYPPLEF